MPLDPRTPVLVGAGQWSNRVDRGEPAVEPAEMMAEALRRAGDRQRRRRVTLLRQADAVRVLSVFSRRYRNAARLVAERIGARPATRPLSPIGGNEPQTLVSRACLDIAAGDARHRADLRGRGLAHPLEHAARRDSAGRRQDDSVPEARLTAPEVELNHPAELARHLLHADAGLPAVRAGAAPPGRAARWTTTSSTSASCGPASRRWPPRTRTRGSRSG